MSMYSADAVDGRETCIEHDRNDHQPGIKVYQRSVFHQAILLEQTLLDDTEEVPVQASVDEANQTLGGPVPVLVDGDKPVIRSRQLPCQGVSSPDGVGWQLTSDSREGPCEQE